MLILATTLLKKPVVSPSTGRLGDLGEPIIDPQGGRLLGFNMIGRGFFSTPHVISVADIIVLDKRVIIINDPQSIVKPEEIVRIKDILDKKFRVIGCKAVTESGTNLGHVTDVLINTEPAMVVRYYLHHLLKDRIIPVEKVVRITPKKIIFSDDVISLPATAQGAPA